MQKKLLAALGFIALLIAVSIGGLIGKGTVKSIFSPPKPSPQEVEATLIEGFTKTANQYNQKLPMMLDQDTRLDKVTVGPGPRVVYHHTFPNYTSKDIDVNWLQTNLKPEIMRKVCSSTDMKKSLQYGGIYVYAYYGSDGGEINRFEIGSNDCGFPRVPPYSETSHLGPSSQVPLSQNASPVRGTSPMIPPEQKLMSSAAPSTPSYEVDQATKDKMHKTALKIYREYPFLDGENEKANSKAISAVAQTCAKLAERGMSLPDALRIAASQVGPQYGPSDEKSEFGNSSIDSFCIMLSKPIAPYNPGK